VIYVEGYDPQGATGYYGLFRAAMRRFLRVWPVKAEIGELQIDSDAFAHWTIDLTGPNWDVATHYTFLRQVHIISANIAESMVWQVPRALGWVINSVLSGTMARMFRASWRFATHLVYFQVLLLIWVALGAAAGWLAALAAMHWAGVPGLVAGAIGVLIAIAVFALLRPVFNRWHVTQIINHWPLLRRFARGEPSSFDRPIEDGARHLIAMAQANDADEIVVVGHSGGGVLAPTIVARALKLDPDLGRHGPSVVLLTLGSIMPGVALHPTATRMRAAIGRLATEPSLLWVDCQSRKDVMNFFDFDPVAGVGIQLGSERCNPRVWLVRFRDIVSPELYQRLRRSLFRLHYQFIMSGDRRGPYDYVMLTCGPLPVSEWARDPHAALASFAEDGALPEVKSDSTSPATAT
jgi:hypothetical protein